MERASETNSSREEQRPAGRWLPLAINFWIAGVITLFLVLRVVDSQTVRRLLQAWGAH